MTIQKRINEDEELGEIKKEEQPNEKFKTGIKGTD
jgi:hypothetical protein